MKLLTAILDLIYPPKCVLCGNLLEKDETDLCRRCRYPKRRKKAKHG